MRERLKSIISAFTGHEKIIAVPRILISMTGDWTVAAMLNQLLYWSGQKDWVYKSLSDWEDEVGAVTRYKAEKLSGLSYVETELRKANGAPTTHYRIRWDLFEDELIKALSAENNNSELLKTTNPIAENNDSLTEITAKTTTKIKDVILKDEPEYVDIDDYGIKEKPKVHHREMVGVLAKVTKMDLGISINAGRLNRASKQLRDAGYTSEDVRVFGENWKKDWRYKQDKKPPPLTTILTEIAQVKDINVVDADKRKRDAFAEIERANNGQ